jgi:hypothetical protein
MRLRISMIQPSTFAGLGRPLMILGQILAHRQEIAGARLLGSSLMALSKAAAASFGMVSCSLAITTASPSEDQKVALPGSSSVARR